jgi:hypothetical protein
MRTLTLLADVDIQVPKVTMNELVTNALNIVYFVVGIVAVIIMVIAGFKYLTSNGEPALGHSGARRSREPGIHLKQDSNSRVAGMQPRKARRRIPGCARPPDCRQSSLPFLRTLA